MSFNIIAIQLKYGRSYGFAKIHLKLMCISVCMKDYYPYYFDC
jgi:hypothetical protein